MYKARFSVNLSDEEQAQVAATKAWIEKELKVNLSFSNLVREAFNRGFGMELEHSHWGAPFNNRRAINARTWHKTKDGVWVKRKKRAQRRKSKC